MRIIKAFLFACLVLSILTASRCFISSSSKDDGDDKVIIVDDGFIIVTHNAEKTSSEVIESLTQTLMAAETTNQSAEYVDSIISPAPVLYTCYNASGIISVRTNDLDNSTTISIGDELLLNYSNCNSDNVIANGDITISILDIQGIDVGNYASGTSWLYSVSSMINALQISRGNETFAVDGELVTTVEYNATTTKLKNNITSNALSIDNESTNLLSDINISQSINFSIVPMSYTLVIESLKISSGTQNGTVVATKTSDALSGMELLSPGEYFVDLLSPENGKINIVGKTSHANLSIMPDQSVTIDVDTNGDSIIDTTVTSSWSKLQ